MVRTFTETPISKKNDNLRALAIFFGIFFGMSFIFLTKYPFVRNLLERWDIKENDMKVLSHFLFLGILGIVLLIMGLIYLRKYLVIHKLPRSRIGGLREGVYAEIQGIVKSSDLFETPLSHKHTVWYKILFEHRKKNKWHTFLEFQPANFSFQIDDGTGSLSITSSVSKYFDHDVFSKDDKINLMRTQNMDEIKFLIKSHPDLVSKLTPNKWVEWRVTEYCVLPGQTLYALGNVATENEGLALERKKWLPCIISLGDEQKLIRSITKKMWISLSIAMVILVITGYVLSLIIRF